MYSHFMVARLFTGRSSLSHLPLPLRVIVGVIAVITLLASLLRVRHR